MVATKMPNATAVLENTPIKVSAAWLLLLRTKLNRRENTIEKTTATQVGAAIPIIHPMAMPVKAECPKASEKKLILPVTIIVDVSPNRGASKRIARKAFFMKSQWRISNGSISQKEYQSAIKCHQPFC